MGLKDFFFGSKPKTKYQSNLSKEQQPLLQQLIAAIQGQGAGGAYGSAADYYRDLLSPDSQTAQAMFAPEMRNFNEEIIPGLAEQFAGMGSGGLSSSGFRNAGVAAGTDLQERLANIRAQLKQQGAQGLMNIGNQGLQQYGQNTYQPGTQGFLSSAAGGLGSAFGGAFGGQIGQGIGNMASGWLNQSTKGTSSPYGNQNGGY